MKFNLLMKYTSLLLVGLLTGNSFAFVLKMGSAIEKLSASSYIAFHESMQRSFHSWTPTLCVLLILSLVSLLISLRQRWQDIEFFFVLFALICILDEIFMTWTGNDPLNRIIQSWQIQGTPAGWADIRAQWLYFMYWRCALLISAFGLLLASVFATKSEYPLSQDVVVAV